MEKETIGTLAQHSGTLESARRSGVEPAKPRWSRLPRRRRLGDLSSAHRRGDSPTAWSREYDRVRISHLYQLYQLRPLEGNSQLRSVRPNARAVPSISWPPFAASDATRSTSVPWDKLSLETGWPRGAALCSDDIQGKMTLVGPQQVPVGDFDRNWVRVGVEHAFLEHDGGREPGMLSRYLDNTLRECLTL